ncbi:adenine deaminase C-terminal domain-containing protein [Thermoflavimicrobium daqui]|uniref:adenine deaminase n=1 Tax=Thermoflavimicrobium daqui TaxID=2137476 RepID=A0A364K4P8_9BACL|nr:adenine deaminase C-terminal domain-containing protein [Thermoflavimicrobium daqui]RAL24354.1 adenine deaminase [Thermoflavimicrobium daqui]
MGIQLTLDEQILLSDVVMGRKKPTRLIKGGTILNVYTGRLEKKDIALAGKRIAFIGNLKQSGLYLDSSIESLDLTGYTLVPGYIEPHAHPTQLYNPLTLAEKVLTLGTTTLINDNMTFFTMWNMEELLGLLDQLENYPVKQFWWARLDAQTYLNNQEKELFSTERVQKFLFHPLVIQAGELTDWLPLLMGDETMLSQVTMTKQAGKRVEGHASGASYRTLSRLAAIGVTADHESISVEEVWNRLELGYMTTLRHSSIRPDLPILIEGLLQKENVPWHRLMLTTDGATPLYLKQGFQDHIIRVAIHHGCDPIHAYQMVTINPAIYYHMEEHIGGLAPGRLANINVLNSLQDPTPVMVLVDGELVAKQRKMLQSFETNPWNHFKSVKWGSDWRIQEEEFSLPSRKKDKVPIIQLVNAVITKLQEENLEEENGWVKWEENDDRLLVYLISPVGKWMTSAFLRGFARNIDGLASSYNGSHDLLVIGRDKKAMAQAANHVLEHGGGITWVQNSQILYHIPLPISGFMSTKSVDELNEQLEPFITQLRAFGYTFSDPLYTFLFLSSTHLPQIRLTRAGIMQVKEKKILYSASKRGI